MLLSAHHGMIAWIETSQKELVQTSAYYDVRASEFYRATGTRYRHFRERALTALAAAFSLTNSVAIPL
jgi:hypothetical protein